MNTFFNKTKLFAMMLLVTLVLAACGPNQSSELANALSTIQAYEQQPTASPGVDYFEDLITALAENNAQLTQIAALQFTETPAPATATMVATSTPLPPPTSDLPSDAIEVIVKRNPRLNVFEIVDYNNSDKPILEIVEPRIQYSFGETFFVHEDPIVADGGRLFYEVIGPRGEGFYVRADQIIVP